MIDPDKKTPYQGRNRCRGYFNCDYGHHWISNWSWANYGLRCRECVKRNVGKNTVTRKEALSTPYTYPHAQEPLQERWLWCDNCDHEEESKSPYPKPKKCRCGEMLYPIIYLTCPHCKYEHIWAEDIKTARKFKFICKDYAEPEYGPGCDKVIGILLKSQKEERTGPHPQELCEKCDEIGCSCTRQKRSRRRRRKANMVQRQTESTNVSTDESNSPVNPGPSEKAKKKRSRRRKKKSAPSNVDELCEGVSRL